MTEKTRESHDEERDEVLDALLNAVCSSLPQMTRGQKAELVSKFTHRLCISTGRDLQVALDRLGDALGVGETDFLLTLAKYEHGPCITSVSMSGNTPRTDPLAETMIRMLAGVMDGDPENHLGVPYTNLENMPPKKLHDTLNVTFHLISQLIDLTERIENYLQLDTAEPGEGERPH